LPLVAGASPLITLAHLLILQEILQQQLLPLVAGASPLITLAYAS
jgi:hypothetical protein